MVYIYGNIYIYIYIYIWCIYIYTYIVNGFINQHVYRLGGSACFNLRGILGDHSENLTDHLCASTRIINDMYIPQHNHCIKKMIYIDI